VSQIASMTRPCSSSKKTENAILDDGPLYTDRETGVGPSPSDVRPSKESQRYRSLWIPRTCSFVRFSIHIRPRFDTSLLEARMRFSDQHPNATLCAAQSFVHAVASVFPRENSPRLANEGELRPPILALLFVVAFASGSVPDRRLDRMRVKARGPTQCAWP
jgi:hypothetical protein